MKIRTEQLKEMLTKSIKAAGNNKLIPITSMLSMEVVNGDLCLTTTDSTTYLYVYAKDIGESDFKAVVDVELFSKLISKMTTEFVELVVNDSVLEVTGNGKYRLDLRFDDEGALVKFPEFTVNKDVKYTITPSFIKSVLTVCKPSLADSIDRAFYTGYYMHDSVITTDSIKISQFKYPVFEEPVLLTSEAISLLEVFTAPEILVSFENNSDKVLFESDDCDLFTRSMPDVSEYPITAISRLLDEDYNSTCKIYKDEIIALLERIMLFVGPYDNDAIKMVFTDNSINIKSLQSNGVEFVEYIECENPTTFTCIVNAKMLLEQLKANITDTITIQYGRENALKIVGYNSVQIIALLEE